MGKTKRTKSIREVMTEVGKAADTKLDGISKSVKKHEKDIADIKKMVKEIRSSIARIGGPAKRSAPKKTTARKSSPVKKKTAAKGKGTAKRKTTTEASLRHAMKGR